MEIFIVLIFSFLAFFLTRYALNLNIERILIILLGFVIFFVTFNYPVKSVVLLIFSMLLSPEIKVAQVPGRDVVIRYDDILLIMMFLFWIFRTAIKKEAFLIKVPIQLPLFLYTSAYVLSTILGILRAYLNWQKAFFYVLKYVEYYIMYLMVVNILKDEKDIRKYLKYGLFVLIIVLLYSYYYYFNATGELVRTTAPFEAPLDKPIEAEPASLGGYYLLCMGIILSLISETKGISFFFLILLFILIYPSFLLTFSRASYMGFVGLFLIFLLMVRKKKLFFIISAFFVLSFSIL